MGPERLSKIMTCEKYFRNFRSTFTEDNTARRTRTINRTQTSEEKEFGKFFHNIIQCYVANLDTTALDAYITELVKSQSNEKWTSRLIELLSPHYNTKTADSYLSSGSSENMERYLKRFSEIYHKHKLFHFNWESEKSIRNFEFDSFQLNGDIDLVGIDEDHKRIFLIELKKAQKPYPQWKFQLYLYMLMIKSQFDEYQIFGAIWHPGAKLKAEKLESAEAGILSALEGDATNPIAYICEDCEVWNCEDRK